MSEEVKKHWLKENIEKYKDELIKLSKITKLNLELASLNRKKNIILKNLGKKVFTLVEEGSIDKDLLGKDYIDLSNIFESIEQTKKIIDELKKQQEIEVIKDMPEQPLDNTNSASKEEIEHKQSDVVKKGNENEEFKR